MKKLIALIVAVTLLCSLLTACSLSREEKTVRVGYMSGPTGMGMAKMIHDTATSTEEPTFFDKLFGKTSTKYEFISYTDASLASADLLVGKIDMACLPTNTAATLYNKQNDAVQVLAINCLNSLYIMTKTGTTINSIYDLEGKDIYTIKNGTPAVILQHLLDESGVNANIKTSIGEGSNEKHINAPTDLAPLLITGKVEIALVPEPVASAAPLNIKSQGKDYNYTVAIDLTNAWAEISDSPVAMGCVVANKDFVAKNTSAVNDFLAEYKASIEYISNPSNIDTAADYIVEAGVIAALPAAKSSLKNLGSAITYVDGANMKAILIDFYNTIGIKLIGGSLPGDDFYYEK